jgi:hypothetical protein
MLRLNPNDNQGLRYVLLSCLMDRKRHDEAAALMLQYEDDGAASWAYAAALLDFRINGDTPSSRETRATALKSNVWVPAYLLGIKKVPKELPMYVGIGDENEAVSVATEYVEAWKETPGAREWLKAGIGVVKNVSGVRMRSN